MINYLLAFIFWISSASNGQAQNYFGTYASPQEKTFAGAGYNWQNRHFLKLTGKYYFYDRREMLAASGINGHFSYYHNRFVAIPELYLELFPGNINRVLMPFARTNVSPWHFTPEAGVSFSLLTSLSFGYAVPLKKPFTANPVYDNPGFRISLDVTIPLKMRLTL